MLFKNKSCAGYILVDIPFDVVVASKSVLKTAPTDSSVRSV